MSCASLDRQRDSSHQTAHVAAQGQGFASVPQGPGGARDHRPDGTYQIKYDAQDLPGNISQTGTFTVTVDTRKPTTTVKSGEPFTVPERRGYSVVSFTLFP
jgi:hypothetical protein